MYDFRTIEIGKGNEVERMFRKSRFIVRRNCVNVIFGKMSKLKILQPAEENQEFLDIDETASNDGDDEQKHEKLLNAIAKLGKNKK